MSEPEPIGFIPKWLDGADPDDPLMDFMVGSPDPEPPPMTDEERPKLCRKCYGTGEDPDAHHRYTSGTHDDKPCPRCHGSGGNQSHERRGTRPGVGEETGCNPE